MFEEFPPKLSDSNLEQLHEGMMKARLSIG